MLQKNMKNFFLQPPRWDIFWHPVRQKQTFFFPLPYQHFFMKKIKKSLLEENQIMKVFCMYLENLLEKYCQTVAIQKWQAPEQ